MTYYDVYCFLPIYLLIEYFTKNIQYSILFFCISVSTYSSYEIINKKYYTLDSFYNIQQEYNIIAEKCVYMCLLYFLYDFFDKSNFKNISFIFHHILFILTCLYVLYYKYYLVYALYLCCHEISTIFLTLKYLNIYKNFSDKMFILTFLSIRCTSLPILVVESYTKDYFLFIILLSDSILHIYWIITKINNINKKKLNN